MNLNAISKRAVGSTELFMKKHGPALLTAAGVTGFVATTYLVGKAVLKTQEPVSKLKLETNIISGKTIDEDYTKQDQVREMGELWVAYSYGILKVFAPAIATGSASIFCVIASHGMMKNRQTALVAAYTALDQGFRAYRKRVEEEIGPEKELELYRGVKMVERKEGDTTTSCEIDRSSVFPSPYAKFFDQFNKNWEKTPEYNLMFLRQQQNYANDRLRSYGFVFLNEIYEWLGIPRTQAGQIVGWKLDNGGDGFIDFGIYDIFDESSRAFVNGLEGAILLDFNVDGVINIS